MVFLNHLLLYSPIFQIASLLAYSILFYISKLHKQTLYLRFQATGLVVDSNSRVCMRCRTFLWYLQEQHLLQTAISRLWKSLVSSMICSFVGCLLDNLFQDTPFPMLPLLHSVRCYPSFLAWGIDVCNIYL